MSLYNYIGTPNSNLICCICRAPFTDPLTTATCQHTFCRECILRALSHAPQCPVDRSPLLESELVPTNSIVRSLVDELIVECVYKEEGCSHQGERQQLASHLQEQCSFSEDGKYRREMDEKQLQAPTTSNEGETAEEVPLAPNTESLPPATQSTHLDAKVAPKAHDPRVSQLKEQNILLRHRVESLESMVQVFKKEMSAVKMVLGPWMRNAMTTQAPRNRSGPINDPGPSTSIEPIPLPVISESSSSIASQSPSIAPPSPPESTAGDDSSSSHASPPPPSVINAEDLASYFPADDEVRVQRQAQPQNQQLQPSSPYAQRPRPSHSHHHSVPAVLSGDPYSNYASNFGYTMGHGGYNTMSPSFPAYTTPGPSSSTPVVHDLAISSPSILDTLQGLHSNLAGLSSNIDELNHKTDLALNLIGGGGVTLMNGGVVGEVLRLGEEVMGVRANVQGLRMQVHGMLMGAVGVGGSSALSNPALPRPPNPQPSSNSEDDASLAGRGQIPFPANFGSPSMGLNPMQRFGPFPGALGITKL